MHVITSSNNNERHNHTIPNKQLQLIPKNHNNNNAVTDLSFSSSVNVFAGKNNVHSAAFCANWFFMNWHMLSIISGHIYTI